MRTLSKRDTMHSVGNQIGVGKESGTVDESCCHFPASPRGVETDIYIVADSEANEMVLKLHRSTHLPTIMTAHGLMMLASQTGTSLLPRDQGKARLHGKTQVSIMDVHVSPCCAEGVGVHEGRSVRSRPQASSNDVFHRQILHEHGFPVPRPIDQSRHTVLMEFIDAYPLSENFCSACL